MKSFPFFVVLLCCVTIARIPATARHRRAKKHLEAIELQEVIRSGASKSAKDSRITTFRHEFLEAWQFQVQPEELITGAYNAMNELPVDVKGAKNADYIPALAAVNPNMFAVAITTVDGDTYVKGNTVSTKSGEVESWKYKFSIQSISKAFTLAQAMDLNHNDVQHYVGIEPTGMPFNSIISIEQKNQIWRERSAAKKQMDPSYDPNEDRGIQNPMVNAGALATVSLLLDRGRTFDDCLAMQSKFAGHELSVIETIYKSEAATNYRNRAIANLLYSLTPRRLCMLHEKEKQKKKDKEEQCSPESVVDVYTRLCSVGVDVTELSVMGATLANLGVNPITGEQVVKSEVVPEVLSIMAMCGFYDDVGNWAFHAGIPGKTGVGGGIVAVVPGKFAVAAFAPPLDAHGNSARAEVAIEHIIRTLRLSMFENIPTFFVKRW